MHRQGAASLDSFIAADGFAVSILAETQKEASGVLASKRADKFAAVGWHPGPAGHPIVDGAVSWFDCARHAVIDAGDHVVLIGRVEGFAYSDANPLGYSRGYVTLGLEQAAVNALSQGARTIVGAILEVDGGLLLMKDAKTGGLTLPEVGRYGPSGSASLLRSALAKVGIEANLGFLFAVFENPESHVQSIYYRGDAVLICGYMPWWSISTRCPMVACPTMPCDPCCSAMPRSAARDASRSIRATIARARSSCSTRPPREGEVS